MLKVDTSDFTRLANEYRQRAAALQSRPLGHDTSAVGFAIKDVFKDVLMDNEGKTLSQQQDHYSATGTGWYGTDSGGQDMAKVNPQEWIDPGNRGILGPGRFYGSSDVLVSPSGNGANVDLVTQAQMQPYPNVENVPGQQPKVTYNLPLMPIMHYFRRGWVDPANPKHHMKPRPIGKRVAAAGAARNVVGRFIGQILEAAGFKRR